jgi:hypothetical protein
MLQSGGHRPEWTIVCTSLSRIFFPHAALQTKSTHKYDALELVDKLWTHFDNNTDPREDRIINPTYVKPPAVHPDDLPPPLSKQQQKKRDKQLKFDNYINLASQCRRVAAICAYSYNISQFLEDMYVFVLCSCAHFYDSQET